jgi:hypothetical protein
MKQVALQMKQTTLLFLMSKLPDLSVHGHVLSFRQLEVLTAAGVDAAIGMDGGVVDQCNVLPYNPGMAVVFFQQLAVFHKNISFGTMAGRFWSGKGNKGQKGEANE